MADRTAPFRTMLVSTWAVISGFGATFIESMDLLETLLAGSAGLATLDVAVGATSVVAGAVLLVVGVLIYVSPSGWMRYVGAGAFLVVAGPLVPTALVGGTNAAVVVVLNAVASFVLLACSASDLCADRAGDGYRAPSSASRLGAGGERNTPGRRR